jgi:ribosomal protein S18 acetylase RimI-like enzyme
MSAYFLRRPAISDEHPQVETLRVEQVRDLRLPWLSRFTRDTLAAQVAAHPGMALWVPRTGEYVVAGPWRHRRDIAQLLEVHARRGRPALVSTLLDRLRDQGYELAVVLDDEWAADPRLFQSLGFEHLERVVYFQKDLRRAGALQTARTLPSLDFARPGLQELDLLVQLDHESFPWLWWNSREEFDLYIRMDGVHIYSAFHQGQPVGYASFTMYDGWAHLDRLGVVAQHQGKGFGAAQLHHALLAMSDLDAAYVTLSTQESNVQSHRLYGSFGFRQTTEHMNLYGVTLDRG